MLLNKLAQHLEGKYNTFITPSFRRLAVLFWLEGPYEDVLGCWVGLIFRSLGPEEHFLFYLDISYQDTSQ